MHLAKQKISFISTKTRKPIHGQIHVITEKIIKINDTQTDNSFHVGEDNTHQYPHNLV